MENIDNVKHFVEALDASTNSLAARLKPILSKTLEENVAACDTPMAKIKYYNNYLYVLVSLIFAYVKSVGIDTSTHPIMKELARVKTYMQRQKQLEARLSQRDTTDEDALAAKTFLRNALGGKVNGGGAAATAALTRPAISSGNFGTHTKFSDDGLPKPPAKLPAKLPVKLPAKPKPQTKPKKSSNTTKVTKPKTKRT